MSSDFSFTLKRVKVLDAEIAYVDTTPEHEQHQQPVILFIHSNPTSSYLWRNSIPHVCGQARCLAPDLIGMGASDKLPHLAYRFIEHALYLDAFCAAIIPSDQKVILVLHDWDPHWGLIGHVVTRLVWRAWPLWNSFH